jgi:hypothetical protein
MELKNSTSYVAALLCSLRAGHFRLRSVLRSAVLWEGPGVSLLALFLPGEVDAAAELVAAAGGDGGGGLGVSLPRTPGVIFSIKLRAILAKVLAVGWTASTAQPALQTDSACWSV